MGMIEKPKEIITPVEVVVEEVVETESKKDE